MAHQNGQKFHHTSRPAFLCDVFATRRANAPQNMYHLLDEDQVDLDGFNAFGPDSTSGAMAGAEVSAAATQAAPSVGGPARSKTKAKKGGGGAGGEAGKKGKGKGTASTTGTQRGKAGGPAEGMDKEEMRRLGLYAAFLLPLADSMCPNRKRANVSICTFLAI